MPALPWRFRCTECSFFIEVGARGGRGRDEGAGVEAAFAMRRHVAEHGLGWIEFLSRLDYQEAVAR